MGRVRWWLNALSFLLLSIAFALFYNKWRSLSLLESNQCSMTYMWRRIYYLNIGIKHDAYSLLLYAEGLHRAQSYGKAGQLDGFPLIFVPGNAGSGRQVRSLGSLLQNKTERLGTHFHFDTFAVDFNGEMTALNFDYIESQAQFLAASIDHILSLYSPRNLPKIVLIGHSMGGIVIQKMLTDNSDRRRRISFIITLATPFSQPPMLFEKRFLHFWDAMNAAAAHLEKSDKNGGRGEEEAALLPKIVSVSGGLLDEFVDEAWTHSPAVNVHAHSAAIDRIWADADHLCIVWCNQIVRQTSRFLFDYAASPIQFMEKFHDFAHLHYHSLGLQLSPISSESITLVDVNVSLCAPKCPIQSVYQQLNLLTNSHGKGSFLLLAIANLTDRGNLIQKFDLLSMPERCGQNSRNVAVTRFLNSAHLFVFANLSNCDGHGKVLVAPNTNLWIFDDDAVFLPEIHLSFGDFIWNSNALHEKRNFSMEMNPLAIIPIHFPRNEHEFGIFRVEIWRRKCRETGSAVHRRIVFFASGIPRRFDKFDSADSNSSSLLIYPTITKGQPPEGMGTHYQLIIIDTAQCAECSVLFSLDLRFSLIKIFRRSQHLLPASCVFASFFVHFYVRITSESRLLVNLFVLPILFLAAFATFGTDVLLLLLVIDSVALLFFHLFLFTVLPFASAVHRPFCSFTSSLPLSVLFFFLFALSTTFTNNTFPLAMFCLCLNIAALHRRFVFSGNAIAFSSASLLLALPVAFFQFPHIFTWAWNLAKYGQLWSLSDPFWAPNFALSLFSFFTLFFPSPLLKLSDAFLSPKFLALSLFPFFFVVFFTFSAFFNPMSFFVLDDLSLLTVFAFAIVKLIFAD